MRSRSASTFALVTLLGLGTACGSAGGRGGESTPPPDVPGILASAPGAPASLAQEAYVKASNTAQLNYFGVAVAVSGDTLVVGAAGENSRATGVDGDQTNTLTGDYCGAAYVYVRSGSTWTQQAYLKASNTDHMDFFGAAVGIDGDTIVVGAPGENSRASGVNGNQADEGAPDSGAAYVFVRSGSTWRQQAYLKASDTGAGDDFGASVAVSRDTIVVGAPGEAGAATGVDGPSSEGAANSGAAYVFTRTGGSWSGQAYVKASNTQAGDQFGCSVAVSGDTLAAGARTEDSAATGVNGSQTFDVAAESGAAYVFTRAAGRWTQQAYLKASNTGAADHFGGAVALDADTLVVGAFREDSGATSVNGNANDEAATESGAAYVFVRHGGLWSQEAYLKGSQTGVATHFGFAVAVARDAVGVGAPAASGAGPASNLRVGLAYVFTRSAGTWTQVAALKASNSDEDDDFGSAVALHGGLLAVGAPAEDSPARGVNGDQGNGPPSATNSGAVYLFR